MNNDFTNSIQPNFDYLSRSSIWKNGLIPHLEGNFVAPNFNDLCANNLYATSASIPSGTELFDCIGCVKDYSTINPNTFGATQIDYLKNNRVDLSHGKEFLNSTLFVVDENPHWHIADAGVHCKSLAGSYNLNDFYTTPGVANEAGGNLAHFLSQDNICLQSFTPGNFKEYGNIVTVTSPFGAVETVSFHRENNSTLTLACGHIVAATLTNTTTGESVTICGNMLYSKSTNDFGIAVNGIAFHTTCNIHTEDKCLGYAFSGFYSFCPSGNTYWEDKMNIKNNFLCSHNH